MSARPHPSFGQPYRDYYRALERALRRGANVAFDPAEEAEPRAWFRPKQLIVHKGDEERIQAFEQLRGFRPVPHPGYADDRPETRVPLPFRLYVNRQIETSDLLARIDSLRDADPSLRVGLNHLVSGLPNFGCPAGPPEEAEPLEEPCGDEGSGVTVGVIDTGYWPSHPWFRHRVRPLAGAVDFEQPNGPLDFQAGHGTHVAGIVRRMAPAANLVVAGPLSPFGVADDASVSAALALMVQANVRVVNMSLGSFTRHDRPPTAQEAVIQTLPRDVAVVAGAGNKATSRPMWPAAFKNVTAVGALDEATGTRADFSNYGSWVDACGPGVDLVSAFFEYRGPIRATGRKVRDFTGFAAWSGTSFATPQFAGAVAALLSRSPGMPARVAAAHLLSSGSAVPGLGTEFQPHL
jgi:hypothetical protein